MIEAQIYYSIQYRWSSMNIGVTATLFVLTLRYHIFVFLSLHAAVKKKLEACNAIVSMLIIHVRLRRRCP